MERMDIYRIGSWRWIVVSLIFTIFFGYFVFGPYGTKLNVALGEEIIDSKFILSQDYISKYIDKVREDDLEHFVYLHVLDSFFALSYSFLLWSISVKVFLQRLKMSNEFLTVFVLFGGLFDLIENILLICLVFFKEKVHAVFSKVLIFVTPAKFLLLAVVVLIILVGIVVVLFKKSRGEI
ncbi:hypothetical protein [Fervidobacterium islandicum]|uniref:Uncharacterized protein n=1 Tax=Fervidobacterium islandicum TaxID=2423 RepID=A0AAI8GDR1_FERIS|nr:hypothetical protein [Fervidobacterium islandicum]AMW33280.1 hypothetical protein NA23_08560 [Fervidobacterium islandicum]